MTSGTTLKVTVLLAWKLSSEILIAFHNKPQQFKRERSISVEMVFTADFNKEGFLQTSCISFYYSVCHSFPPLSLPPSFLLPVSLHVSLWRSLLLSLFLFICFLSHFPPSSFSCDSDIC